MPFPEIDQQTTRESFHFENISPEEVFASEFIKLGGKFVFCDNEQEMLDNIHALYDDRGWNEILCAEPHILKLFQNNLMNFTHEFDPSNTTADVCITGCELLAGRTGTVIISSKQNFGRISPVFYPVHIIIAYSSQAVRDIHEGLEEMKNKYGDEMPSMINLNTGPSRTADIEKTLVVGVHGPGEVFCFFINA